MAQCSATTTKGTQCTVHGRYVHKGRGWCGKHLPVDRSECEVVRCAVIGCRSEGFHAGLCNQHYAEHRAQTTPITAYQCEQFAEKLRVFLGQCSDLDAAAAVARLDRLAARLRAAEEGAA